jgi:uncharacterized membrane protein
MKNIAGSHKIAAALCARHVRYSSRILTQKLLIMRRNVSTYRDLTFSAIILQQIGGAVNFVAVSDVLQTPPALVAAALAADNVVIAVYFAFLFSLCRPSSEEELLAMEPRAGVGESVTHASCQ